MSKGIASARAGLKQIEARVHRLETALGIGTTQVRSWTGAHLRSFRRAAGLTQGDLAAYIGVDQSRISEWERAIKTPRGKNLVRLAAVLQCTVQQLWG